MKAHVLDVGSVPVHQHLERRWVADIQHASQAEDSLRVIDKCMHDKSDRQNPYTGRRARTRWQPSLLLSIPATGSAGLRSLAELHAGRPRAPPGPLRHTDHHNYTIR